jgi:hypothetical protein
VCRRIVDLLGLILSPKKRAEAAATALDTVDQGLPSERSARRVQKLRNQRKTRCNRSDWSCFGRGLLLWLLGIPLPIILLVWLLGGLHG